MWTHEIKYQTIGHVFKGLVTLTMNGVAIYDHI